MRTVHEFCLIVASILVVVVLGTTSVVAQIPSMLSFPNTPCDATSCLSLVLTNTTSQDQPVSVYQFHDGIVYAIDSSADGLGPIPANGQLTVPVCFTPNRRGVIYDTLLVVRLTASGHDSLRVRLNGRGIGPVLTATPMVLNFPKTTVGVPSTLKVTVANNGETAFQLTNNTITLPGPFQLLTALPVAIPAGNSVQLDVGFAPSTKGTYSIPVDILAGCNVHLQLVLNGLAREIATVAVLRVSKTRFSPENLEQIPLNESECSIVTISNPGTATLVIDSIAWAQGSNDYIIQDPPSTPLVIAPNSQRELTVCLQGNRNGVLRDTMVLRSNSRNPVAFGMIVDVSRSMELNKLTCGTLHPTRMEQAREQANNFLDNKLVYLPVLDVQDQITINRFSDTVHTIFPLTYVDDAVRADAQDSVTNHTAVESSTFTGKAIRSMIDTLATSPVSERSIILITDGRTDRTDSIASPVNTLVSLANAQNIRIFCIGIDLGTDQSAISYLSRLAEGTRGTLFIGRDCNELEGAFQVIADNISKGTRLREPFAALMGVSGVDAPNAPATRLALQGTTPNPVTGSSMLHFTTERAGLVRISIHAADGAVVRTLVDGKHVEAGEHQAEFDSANMPNGIYIVRLSQGDQTASSPIVIVR